MNEISRFLVAHGDLVIFGIVFVEQAGLPLPAAPWLLAAGALGVTGALNPVLAIGTTVLACLLADALWFHVGRRGGQRVLRLFCRLSLARNSCVGRSEGLFARHGASGLVAAKFLPGLGTVMPPLAGALGMGTGRFLLFDGLGSVLYGSFYIGAGFLFHDQLHRTLALLHQFGLSAALLAAVLIGGYVIVKYLRRRAAATKPLPAPMAKSQLSAVDADWVAVPAPPVAADLSRQGVTCVIGDPPGASAATQNTPLDTPSPLIQAVPCSL